MQDLTRLLYLLNKKPSKVQVPPDGAQLLDWSEGILERYLQTQVVILHFLSQQYMYNCSDFYLSIGTNPPDITTTITN